MKVNKILSIHPKSNSVISEKEIITVSFQYPIKDISKVGFNNNTGAKTRLMSNQKEIQISGFKSKGSDINILLDPIRSKDDKSQTERTVLSYFLTDSDLSFKKPNESVVNFRKVNFSLVAMSGSIAKLEDRNGKRRNLFIDESGKQSDLAQLLKKEAKLYDEKYGKIHPALHRRIANLKDSDKVLVEAWYSDDKKDIDKSKLDLKGLEALDKKMKLSDDRLLRARKNIATEIAKSSNAKLLKLRKVAPVAILEISKKELNKLENHKSLEMLFLHEPKGIDDLDNSIQISNADNVQNSYGLTGDGINVAVFEKGPSNQSNLNVSDFYDNSQSATSGHATNVIGIIANSQSSGSNGFAPGCNMHSANDYDLDAFDWAVDERCTVINQSFHRNSEQTSDDLSYDDKYKDYAAYYYPYPSIIQAAGNGSSSEYVNHKGFNSISIANHNDNATAISGSSVFRNPDSPHSDRELPELSANGTGYNMFGGGVGSGTSYSSPSTAGCAALMQEESPLLKYWPEGVRSILFAGARRNISGSTWWSDVISNVDAKDGAGALDCLESIKICKNKKSRNNVPSNRGWDVGSLSNSNFSSNGYSNFEYRIKVPSSIFSFINTKKVKVALAWSNKVTKILSWYFENNVKVDFDLKVYNSSGVQVASSSSWDNSYEIAEFNGNVGEEYTVKIRRWSGNERTYYGLAWSAGQSFSLFPFPVFPRFSF